MAQYRSENGSSNHSSERPESPLWSVYFDKPVALAPTADLWCSESQWEARRLIFAGSGDRVGGPLLYCVEHFAVRHELALMPPEGRKPGYLEPWGGKSYRVMWWRNGVLWPRKTLASLRLGVEALSRFEPGGPANAAPPHRCTFLLELKRQTHAKTPRRSAAWPQPKSV